MRIGLYVLSYDAPTEPDGLAWALERVARFADQAGFDSFWVVDHLFESVGPADAPMLEAHATLGFLAGITSRIQLGALVSPATFRAPALLVQAVASLDLLTSGRANLGVGAGWFEREHLGLGIPFPSRGRRAEQLEEVVRLARATWRASGPRPRILIGGSGELRTLPLVAKYADMANIRGDPALMRHKFNVLRELCDEVGRDYAAIERTCIESFVLSEHAGATFSSEDLVEGEQALRARRAGQHPTVNAAHLMDILAAQAEAGVQHAIVMLANMWEMGPLEALADMLPALRRL